MIVQRIIWNNQFAVEIEKLLASGGRSKEKIQGYWVKTIDFQNKKNKKQNMGSLSDSVAENGGS